MGRRRLLTGILAGWLALALLRLGTNVALGALHEMTWAQLVPVIFGVALFWIPATLVALWISHGPLASHRGRRFVAHTVVILVIIATEPALVLLLLHWTVGLTDDSYPRRVIQRVASNLLLYTLVVAADGAWTRWVALGEREMAAARLERALADIQLHALSIQLQPHFLFNALQFVAETAHDNLEQARRTLGLLRGLLQQAFALETRGQVSVAEEMEFLRAYGEIQQSRFGDRFTLVTSVDDAALDAAVPPLLLQPLVENAVRHGFARRASGGRVEVTVRRRHDVLSIVVADDGNGLPDRVKEGQGLSVTRARLARLYGADAHLSLARANDGRTESRLRLPFRPVPSTVIASVGPAGDDGAAIDDARGELPVAPSSPGWWSRVPFAARIAAMWIVLLTLVVGGPYVGLGLGVFPSTSPQKMEPLIQEVLASLPFWLLLTIIAAATARRFSGRWALGVHGGIALGVAVVHALVAPSLITHLMHGEPMDWSLAGWAPLDVFVYAVIVLLARSHELGEWVRDRMLQEVTLTAEVRRATERLRLLRDTQSALLSAMDAVIASPTMESLDRAVVDFANFLRADVMGAGVGGAV